MAKKTKKQLVEMVEKKVKHLESLYGFNENDGLNQISNAHKFAYLDFGRYSAYLDILNNLY